MVPIGLTPRQQKIADIVHTNGPITGKQIAEQLNVTRAALRSDLAILVMSGLLDARPKVGYFYTGRTMLNRLTEEISNIKVRDIQSVPVVVPVDTSAYDAIVTMFLEDVGTVYVVEDGGILNGVLSRKDLLKAAMGSGSELQKVPVKMLITSISKIIVTTPDEAVLDAAKKIIDNEIDSLPVVKTLSEKHFQVIGRLTKTNITKLFVELGEGKRG